jgi:hypothetical protein
VGANLLGVLLAAAPATGPRPGVTPFIAECEVAFIAECAALAAVSRGDCLVGDGESTDVSIASAASSMRSRADAAAASRGDTLGDDTGEMSAMAADAGAASGSASGSGSAAAGESTSMAIGSGVAFLPADFLTVRTVEPLDGVDSFAVDAAAAADPHASIGSLSRRESFPSSAGVPSTASTPGVLDFAAEVYAVVGVSPAVAYSIPVSSSSVTTSSSTWRLLGANGVPPARLMADLPVAGVLTPVRPVDAAPGIALLSERGVSARVAEMAPGVVRAAFATDFAADGGFSLARSAMTSAAACFAAALVCALSRSATGVLRPAVCVLSNQASGCVSVASPTSKS